VFSLLIALFYKTVPLRHRFTMTLLSASYEVTDAFPQFSSTAEHFFRAGRRRLAFGCKGRGEAGGAHRVALLVERACGNRPTLYLTLQLMLAARLRLSSGDVARPSGISAGSADATTGVWPRRETEDWPTFFSNQ
jgi:hypothetical protein